MHVSGGTAEEFYSRLLGNAAVLDEAARRHAAEADAVAALACALGADVATLESVVWERLNIAPRSPQRQFFQVADALTSQLAGDAADPSAGDGADPQDRQSIADVIAATRQRMVAAFDETLAADVVSRWPGIDYLAEVPAPTAPEIDAAATQRLDGMAWRQFVLSRRAAARTTMLEAQARRVRGEIAEAIQLAYESDFLGLDAYLVESAEAVGDRSLFTVATRWALAVGSVSELSGLPSDFREAVTEIRAAMGGGLGEADSDRLLQALLPI